MRPRFAQDVLANALSGPTLAIRTIGFQRVPNIDDRKHTSGTRNSEHKLTHPTGPERPVGEIAMIPGRDREHEHDVQSGADGERLGWSLRSR